jgi:transposase
LAGQSATAPAAGRAGRRGCLGWSEDQRWALAWVTTLIGWPFHVRYTLRGTSYLLHCTGYTPQVLVQRAAERDEKAIMTWRTEPRRRYEASGGDRSVDLLRR